MPRDTRAKGVPVVIMMMMMMGLVGEISVVGEIVVEIEYRASIHVAPEHQSLPFLRPLSIPPVRIQEDDDDDSRQAK